MQILPITNGLHFIGIGLPNRDPTPIITRLRSAVSHSFRMIDAWFSSALEYEIDLLPNWAAHWLDPKRLIVETILAIPHDQRAAALERLLPCIFPNITQEKQALLIENLTTFTPSFYDSNPHLYKTLLRSIRFETPSPAIADIIFAMNVGETADNRNERPDVIAHALPLFTSEMSQSDKTAIILYIHMVHQGHRADAIARAQELFTPQMNGIDKGNIIRGIAAIPEHERANIIPPIFHSFTPEMARSVADFFGVDFFRNQSTEERINIIANALPLFTPQMNREDKVPIIEAIDGVPNSQRADVIARARELFTPQMNGIDKGNIIRGIAAIPEHERANIIPPIFHFFTPEMARSVADFFGVDFFRNQSTEERINIIANALPLFTPHMNGLDKSQIILAIAGIPTDQRNDFLEKTLPLFNPQMNGMDKQDIIEAIARVPADQRDDVIAKALPVFTPQMNGWDRDQIIQAIAEVSADQRDDVMARTTPLFTPHMNGLDKSQIILAIAGIPTDQREDVVERVLPLFTEQMHEWGKGDIIAATAAAPADQRADIIAHALLLFTPQMNGVDKSEIILAINEVPADERAAYVEARRQGHVFQNAAVAAQGGVNVHEGDRDNRLQSAVGLLRRHQSTLTKESIDGAVEAFIAYLNGQADSQRKQLAKTALLDPRVLSEPYGPLLVDDGSFTILGMEVTGKEMIGRLWIYASTLQEPEQTNAKEGMISALACSYFDAGGRVCNQGKIHRLFIAVLQGRLAGVDIEITDDMQITPAMALNMFFSNKAFREITDLAALLAEATLFCAQNALVSPEAFIAELRNYIATTDKASNMFFATEAHQQIDNLTTLLAEGNRFCDQHALVSRAPFIAELRSYAREHDIK